MIKHYKPTTSGRRKMTVTDYSVLTTRKPVKKLTRALPKSSGRDQTGQISVRHQGGGAKRKYRVLISLDQKLNMPAKIETLEYDPNRSAFINLVTFEDKTKAYILAPEGLKVGDVITSGEAEILKGNRLPLGKIPTGVGIYDLELQPGQGGKLVRSAGNSATIVAKEGPFVQVKLPSGEIRKINKNCFASIGQVSNVTHSAQRIGKAGRKRHMGVRPSVRGKAMHPAAHPHGGGEGVNPIGLKYPKTPWGEHALGVRTRKKNKYSSKMIVRRRKK
ncbi:MAG: 50S ribosomal protein L2 [Patescibacteria group bacterium]|nr:50S ribosomal protein L2 [Patescibacteria group bacterium]